MYKYEDVYLHNGCCWLSLMIIGIGAGLAKLASQTDAALSLNSNSIIKTYSPSTAPSGPTLSDISWPQFFWGRAGRRSHNIWSNVAQCCLCHCLSLRLCLCSSPDWECLSVCLTSQGFFLAFCFLLLRQLDLTENWNIYWEKGSRLQLVKPCLTSHFLFLPPPHPLCMSPEQEENF